MVREISAGGVVIRKRDGLWWMVAIEPAGETASSAAVEPSTSRSGVANKSAIARRKKSVLALPKGLVDSGEKPLDTAVREVFEESGVVADVVTKLADIKYVYTRAWGDGQRVFKIVSFYLMRYRSGRIDDVSAEMRIEVVRARWIRLEDAPKLLAYTGEKKVARLALDYVANHTELEAEV
jgi:8-oxo-dGTP pyrophosphatase MutT (NUDIX family)